MNDESAAPYKTISIYHTIDFYILREYLKVFAFCILFFSVLFVALDLTINIRGFLRLDTAKAGVMQQVVSFFAMRLVVNLNEALPLAIIISCIYIIIKMGSRNEISALMGSGIPPTRIVLPIYFLTLIATGTIFYLNQQIIPDCNFGAREENASLRGGNFFKNISRKIIYSSSDNQRDWLIESFDGPEAITQVRLKKYNEKAYLELELYADHATYTEVGGWEFSKVNIDFYKNDVVKSEFTINKKYDSQSLEFLNKQSNYFTFLGNIKETPSDLLNSRKQPWQRSTFDIIKIISDGSCNDRYISSLKTELYRRLSFPLISIISAVLAAPYLIRNIKRNLTIKAFGCLSILILYLVLNNLCETAGSSGFLPSWIGAFPTFVLIICTIIVNIRQDSRSNN